MPLDHITIVLHQPRFAENIGSTARAAMNLGLRHITLVNPEDTDRERMSKLATHAAAGLLDEMEIKPTLAEALAPFHFIVGTTARLGGERKQIITPAQAGQKILSLGPDNRVALLFGPENRGLSNEELRYCHAVVNIPTVQSSSLNLAQAVLIMAYEIFLAHRIPEEGPGLQDPPRRSVDDLTLKAQRSLEEPSSGHLFRVGGHVPAPFGSAADDGLSGQTKSGTLDDEHPSIFFPDPSLFPGGADDPGRLPPAQVVRQNPRKS